MTYDNARLPEALLRAGRALGDEPLRATSVSRRSTFYEQVTIEDGVFVPIGNDGWYRARRPPRALRQQPLEATVRWSTRHWRRSTRPATRAISPQPKSRLAWFYGRNSRGVVDGPPSGGCSRRPRGNRKPQYGRGIDAVRFSAALAMAERRPRTLRAVR